MGQVGGWLAGPGGGARLKPRGWARCGTSCPTCATRATHGAVPLPPLRTHHCTCPTHAPTLPRRLIYLDADMALVSPCCCGGVRGGQAAGRVAGLHARLCRRVAHCARPPTGFRLLAQVRDVAHLPCLAACRTLPLTPTL